MKNIMKNIIKPKSMPRYFFRFTFPTRLTGSSWKVHQKWEQQIIQVSYPKEGITLMVFDKRIKKGATYLHYGLGFDIELPAKNKESARIVAEKTVFEFLALITYIESCYADIPTLILSYRKPDSGLWLEEYQAIVVDYSYWPVETSLKLINLPLLNDFIEKMKVVNSEARVSIDGALHWYWKALGSKDQRDRFINLWVSLEFLEQPLKSYFNLPTDSLQKLPQCPSCKKDFSVACPFCGENYHYSANTDKTGIKQLELKISEKIMKFSDLHSFRSRIIHPGIKDLQEFKSKYSDIIFSTRALINYAIFALLGLDMANAIPLAKIGMRGISLPMLLEFKGQIKVSESISIEDVEKQPVVYGGYKFNFEIKTDTNELIQLPEVKHTFEGVFETGQVEKIIKIDSSLNTEDVWERKP